MEGRARVVMYNRGDVVSRRVEKCFHSRCMILAGKNKSLYVRSVRLCMTLLRLAVLE